MVKVKRKDPKQQKKSQQLPEDSEDPTRIKSASEVSMAIRGSIDDVDEVQREGLEDAKETLLEAVEYLNIAIEHVNKDTLADGQSDSIKTIGDLVLDSSTKLTRCTRLIEKLENLKKLEMKKSEQSQHRINTLELELRKQGDISYILQGENEALSIIYLLIFNYLVQEIELLKKSEKVRVTLEKEIQDLELKFSKERFDLVEKSNKLELKLKNQQEINQNLTKRLSDLKEDMNMIGELNDKKVEELQEQLDGNSNFEEVIQNYKKLKERNNTNSELIDKLQNEKSRLQLRVQELESNLQQEEMHQKELEKEIEVLNKNIYELEEKFSKEKIEGNAHIGLSKIDFMQNNLAFSRVSLGKSYFRKSKMPDIPEDESTENSQIMLAPPKPADPKYSIRSSVRNSRVNRNFFLKIFSRLWKNDNGAKGDFTQ